MNTKQILEIAKIELEKLDNHLLDVVDITRPNSLPYAKQLAKVISKLSPLLGNMIEFSTVDLLNTHEFGDYGNWIRQDPGFPDALFKSDVVLPNPGLEIKAWFPLATEITARFKDSVTTFSEENIDVALIAWIPENIIWGKPKIIDILIVSGKSVAEARDLHYHKPPHYLVFEPEDTSQRTANLQQSNTNGYKLQEDKCDVLDAIAYVDTWGEDGKKYSPSPEYQNQLRILHSKYIYRLDTNYAKIDRIKHSDIEVFKKRVLSSVHHGKSIREWQSILSSSNNEIVEEALNSLL